MRYRGADVRERDPLELRREVVPGSATSGAARRDGRRRTSASRPSSPAREPDVAAAARPRRARRQLRRPRRRRSSRSASSSGRCSRARWRSSRGAAARRADLGARPRDHGRGRGDAARSFASGSRSRSCWSPTTSARRGGCRTGWCGSTPAARSSRARRPSCSRRGSAMTPAVGIQVTLGEVGREPRPGRDRDRRIGLVADRARGRHRDRRRPLVRSS